MFEITMQTLYSLNSLSWFCKAIQKGEKTSDQSTSSLRSIVGTDLAGNRQFVFAGYEWGGEGISNLEGKKSHRRNGG